MKQLFIFSITTLILCFSSCDKKESNLYRINIDGKLGYIDSLGNIKISPKYIYAGNFNEGLAMVVIDTIPFKNEKIENLESLSLTERIELASNPRKKYKKILKYGYIDKENNFVIAPTLYYKVPRDYRRDASITFSQGLAVFQDTATMKFGYIDKNGTVVIPAKYSTAEPFSDSLALVSIEKSDYDDSYGYINLKGEKIIDFKFDEATNFSEGYAVVKYIWHPNSTDITKEGYMDERQESMVINKKGNVMGRPFGGFNMFSEFSNGYILEYSTALDFSRFISKNGEFATGQLEKARPFSDGLAAVRKDGKWGFIDTTFKFIIPPIYTNCDFFSEGLIPVKKGNFWGYIDINSNIVIPFKYDSCSVFTNSLAKFKIKADDYKINGYIDKKGNVIWQKEKFESKDNSTKH